MARKKSFRRRSTLVEFTARKRVPKKQRVSFTTKSGKKVNFIAKKYVQKKEKVSFYSKKK